MRYLSLLSTVVLACFITTNTLAQIVSIPDTNFKAILVNNPQINVNGDAEIQLSEAQAFTGKIDASTSFIQSLIGIEAFTALTALDCSSNNITALNLSANTLLEEARISHNNFTTLDLTQNTVLKTLICGNSPLMQLDLSQTVLLEELDCRDAALTSLDLSANTALIRVFCNNNQLTNLAINNHPNLIALSCNYNQLTTLEVNNNSGLVSLLCTHNQLTSLDVSSNPLLDAIECNSNQLTRLNVKNGNNQQQHPWPFSLDATSNNLTCVDVDNIVFSSLNWMNFVDSGVIFSDQCATSITRLSDGLEALSIYPNPTPQELTIDLGQMFEAVEIEVVDAIGACVFQQRYEATSTLTIDLTGKKGIFFIKINSPEGKAITKVIKY